ncbi:MAG: 6-carboxytetrahydropterin synthase QueD [Candidatus Hydrothermarchaeales archaeon]
MKLGIIEYIDCAHYLPEHKSCGKMHGHTYKIEVTIEGEKKEGIVIDFHELKARVKDVLGEYDHCALNEILEFPSCENLCENIYAKLEKKLEFPFTLRVWEGKGKWVEK